MNDLIDLRVALHDEPATYLRDPDLTAVMTEGRRIRGRHRLLNAASAAGAVVAVVVASFTAGSLSGPRPDPVPTAQGLRPGPVANRDGTVPNICPARRPPPDLPPPQPIGDVIGTGRYEPAGEHVFFIECRSDESGRDTRLVVVSGLRAADGAISGSGATHGIGADGRAMGKYQGVASTTGRSSLPSGYYVGPAARIVGTTKGVSVTAYQATWSEDPDLVVWWFDLRYLTLPFDTIVAYDANGAKLPDA